MVKRWVVGLGVALAVVCMAGVGFSAFTANVAVNGNASAASVNLQIVHESVGSCSDYLNTSIAAGSISFSGLNAALSEVTLNVANMAMNSICDATVVLENTGPDPLSLGVILTTPGSNGLCSAGETDCFDVFTQSGIQANGWICWSGSPDCGGASYSSTGFVTLDPGQTFGENIGVDITPGSGSGTPASAAFSLVYTGAAVA